ncbi:MFS transporter [Kribbella sp. VKM Ac-2568]|uniref:MFS transporter n=1 Tax=Kribbella sp. VKM Ac-2568 TaxID=2512219 RepID=UPI0010ECB245|nr:MFS transporter [Kribbella sp. VKM Ac-2568]TCM47993.1 putative MFS family arabinose efflux permease [Kribbella sp. VKM Ac-2568]
MSERLPASYYLAATLARVGDEMVAFTLVLLVLERMDSPALAGLTGAAYALPAVITGPLLGTWLDRTPYRRTALGLNQAVLGAVMLAMLAVVGHTAHWVTPALAALAGTTLPLVSGGFTSMLPSLVPQPLLARANSLEAASFGAATITGPAAAATIAAAVSVEAAAAVIAVTATLSIFAIMRLPALPAAIDVADREPFLGSVVAGLAHLARTPRLRASTVTTTLLMGVMGVLLITLPLHMESLGAPRSAAGYLWTALEIGSVATALLLGRWQTRWRPEHVVMVSVALYGLAFTTWPLASSLAVLLVLATATGLLEGPMLPAMFSARQQYSSVELQGRVSTTAASLRVGAAALGQAAGGLLVPVVGTHTALLAVGAALLAASALGYLSTLGRAVTPARL